MPRKLSPLNEKLSSASVSELESILLKSAESTEELVKLINSGKQDEESLAKARDLIENGFANVNAMSNKFDKKVEDRLIHTAVRNGNDKMVELLVDNGCDVNAKNKIYELTPLHLAAERTHDKENKVLNELLKAEDIDFNAKDNQGTTPNNRALALNNTTTSQTLSNAISTKAMKEMKEKQEKEWQQKWEGKFEYDNPNKTEWEKEFDRLKDEKPKDPFDSLIDMNAFNPEIARKAFDAVNKSSNQASLEAAAKSFDSQIATTTKKTEAQSPEVKETKTVKKPVVKAISRISDNTEELSIESKTNKLEETIEVQKKGFVSMLIGKVGEFLGLTEKEEKTPLLEDQKRSTPVKSHAPIEKIKTEELVIDNQEKSPLHKSSDGNVISTMSENDKDEIERIKQSLTKGSSKTIGDEVDSPIHSHVNSVTNNANKNDGGQRQ